MIVTEIEARKLWCPLTRLAVMSPAGMASINRHPDDVIESDCRCRASACMLWQWTTPEGETFTDEFRAGQTLDLPYDDAIAMGLLEQQVRGGATFRVSNGEHEGKRARVRQAYREPDTKKRFISISIENTDALEQDFRRGKCGMAPGGEHV